MSGNVTRTWEDVKERAENSGDNVVFGGDVTVDGDIVASAVVQAVTATADGVAALISANADYVTVTSADADFIVNLPAATNGKVIRIFVTATGCEVRSVVAADKVNNVVVGATAEGALAAAIIYTLVYSGGVNWVCTGQSVLGAVSTLVVPDARV